MCRSCKEEPLVLTLAFRGKEFICLGCGTLYEFFGPRGEQDTPELTEKMDLRKQQWIEITAGHIPHGSSFRDCEKCTFGEYDHLGHATPQQLADHEAALARMKAVGQ